MVIVFEWIFIIGSIYGFVLFTCNAVYAAIRLKDFIKSRRRCNGR